MRSLRDSVYFSRISAFLLFITVGFAALLLTCLSLTPRAQAQGVTPPADTVTVKALYGEKCSACHNLPDPVEKSYTRREWQATVNRMLTRHQASNSISPTEAAQIVDYLATFAPQVPRRGRARILDPWATDEQDVWTVAPSATRIFNFETGSLSGLAPLGAGPGAPAPAWKVISGGDGLDGLVVVAHPVKPTPSRFALLMDKADQGKNVDIKVRFRVLHGKVSPAVGLVFGYVTSGNYMLLRYDATKGDLALIQIAGTVHTVLQETPLSLPDATGTARSSTLLLGPGWHTLRLLVNTGQVRGWMDETKRINIADPTYTGGKVGLWAQGDTVAAFDDWSIDLYDTPSPVTTPAS